ncbi:MAG: 50S ribosomal protein P1 [Candidatus Thermoplasmatota archaeon]|nr:50S ribosomal protein P1 [Candidatus Thermoplasmatota archaeon]
MEYIYGALTLHASGKEINEENVKKMLQAVGIEIDDAKVKSLVSSLQKVSIEEVLKTAVTPAAPQVVKEEEKKEKEAKGEEKKEEEKEEASEEDIASGLGALFG